MALLMLTLLAGFTLATGIVLADSGLRLWSAFGTLGMQKTMLVGAKKDAEMPILRTRAEAQVATRVSFSRPAPAPLRVAA